MPFKASLTDSFASVERWFDRLKLGAKWRFDLWTDLRIVPYVGYGTPGRYRLRGRVLDDKAVDGHAHQSAWQNIRDLIRRFETDEIPGAVVRATCGTQSFEATTDENGFFSFDFDPGGGYDAGRAWQEVELTLTAPVSGGAPATAAGRVLVPQETVEFGIISDVDDTVIRTGATDQLKMLRTVVLNNARTRVPFAGVGGLYRALIGGPDGHGHNPLFYVSSSPWNLYDLFETFLKVHDLPMGPIFLKDFGIERGQFMKSGHAGHKLAHIDQLLADYPELPFVLIGDSGQKDPEIYREAVRRHPGRIRAIYLRDVTPEARDREVHTIADALRAEGVEMLLAETSEAAAAHAAEAGLIHPDALETVREDHERERHTYEEPQGMVEKALDATRQT